MLRDAPTRLVRAWLLTAVVDGLFASALSVFAYGSTVTQLWQRVASTLLGPAAFEGGTRTAAIGVLMHFGVALGWSAVFLALVMISPRLRRAIASPAGVVGVAAIYGPAIWLVMSLAIIPFFTGRPPAITFRWWVQLVGHIPFVAIPIVAMIARGSDASTRDGRGRPVERAAVIDRDRATGSLSFTVSSENPLPALFRGTASADGQSMAGTIQVLGGGFVSDTVTFRRQ